MKCDAIQAQLTDYLAGELAAPAKADITAHLAGCPACRAELSGLEACWSSLGALPVEKPGVAARARFEAMLDAYGQGIRQAERETSRRPSFMEWLAGWWPRQPGWQAAIAIALFAFGLLLGPAIAPRGARNLAGVSEHAVDELRQEVANMRQLVTVALLQEPSASERLRGVNWSYRLDRLDQDVLAALLRALDTDPNVNVRLAAVDALHQFAADDSVRQGLLKSLAGQNSPLVHVELINLMVALKEKEAMPLLKQMSQNQDLNPTVRTRAEWGLQKLG